MKMKIYLMITICFYSSFVFSQDMHFSQFYMSPLTINPGMAGVNDNLEAIINYKDQWRGVGIPFTTLAASIDARITRKKLKQGYWIGGLNFFSDKAGDAKIGIAQINLTVGYSINVARYQTLGIGLQGGYAQRSINYDSLQWASQYDPNNGFNSNIPSGESSLSNFSYGDAGAGIVWAFNNSLGSKIDDNHDMKANIGFAAFHAYQKYSFYQTSKEQLYPKYVFHGNALVSIPNSNLAIVPGFMFTKQGPAQEYLFGTLMRYKLRQDSKYTSVIKESAIYIGGYYRAKDAFIASILLEYSSYAIGISYDINGSKLSTVSNGRGGIELSIRYAKSNLFQKNVIKNLKG